MQQAMDPAILGVRVPFWTRSTQFQEGTHLVEEGTLVLVTPTSRVPLWGLSIAPRETLFSFGLPYPRSGGTNVGPSSLEAADATRSISP